MGTCVRVCKRACGRKYTSARTTKESRSVSVAEVTSGRHAKEFLLPANVRIPLRGYICVALEARQQGVTVVLGAGAELTAH